MRYPLHLAFEYSSLCDTTINIILIELQLIPRLLSHKTPIRVLQSCLVKFRLGVAYRECLAETFMAVVTFLAEPAPPLHVVPARFKFYGFVLVSLHIIKLYGVNASLD